MVVTRSTPAERQAIAAAAESVLTTVTSPYARQRFGRFIVEMRGGSGSERAGLLRETGDHHRRIARLLELHEPTEAARVLAEIEEPDELIGCADLFVSHGYPEDGHKVVEDVAASRGASGRVRVLTWLYRHALREADRTAAAMWADEIFQEEPTLEHWGLLRASARGRRRDQLRRQLLEAGEHLLLIEILLCENRAREALAKFRAVKTRTPRALAVMRQIADGVAGRHPRDAARLYAEIADASVRMNDPEVAVALMTRGHDALTAAGHTVLASRYLADFCRRHAGNDELIARLKARQGRPAPTPTT